MRARSLAWSSRVGFCGGERGAAEFDAAAEVEDFEGGVVVERGDGGAFMAVAGDQPLAFQADQGFAHGALADAVAGGLGEFGEGGAWRQVVHDDLAAEFGEDGSGAWHGASAGGLLIMA